ncbi:adenylate/guanylate cyclase domain-containing protein [Planomicrobium sp. CPCC 101079]|uniref:adenylate/guanylate cyclase domain-containing protein n=1 Tax=Planomicrobium sp. CPCC 101079 TaxID=2599618 RepID=UPI0011B59EBD|nr:adenylate/guanylate cyclase domain-containing protein [Planomicrobium sp. CPCC 101079]TWT01107.1 adenylate/guanylate cyclase domain-containing protein [Planomicrobium sp. CPCC 101079]
MTLKAKKYVFEQQFALAKETIWKLISDNNRMNPYIGIFPVQFSGVQKEGTNVFYRSAQAKIAGLIPLKWQEFPFQWEENKSYIVERRYVSGPLVSYTWGIELVDSSDAFAEKTTVRVIAEYLPRNPLGIAVVLAIGIQSMKNTLAYIDDYAKAGADPRELPQKAVNAKVNFVELERLEDRLRKFPVDASYIVLLHRFLVEKSDSDVAVMEPIQIAKQWKKDSEEVLRMLLYATKSGILNLSWNLICPNCRVSKVDYSSLSQLQNQFHCDLCGINYDADFDRYVELQFSVHPSIRKAYAEVYCVGAPQITPHIKVQKIIGAGQTIVLPITSAEKALRLRVLQENNMVDILDKLPAEGHPALLEYTEEGWSHSNIARRSEISLTNSSQNDIIVALEQSDWNAETVTAAKVTAMQEFRDLFSSEVLSPGQQISIRNVTIMFTDLKGSTSLYETVGDATAYGQVNRHFEFLTHWISKNSGSVVKTIGDAVMAVFHLPEDGLRAALQIQQHVAEFNNAEKEDIMLKIGLHSGPAIAVNSNDRLDYFGRTVNVAARLQGEGVGGDLVIGRDFLEQVQANDVFAESSFMMELFHANLKGIEGQIELVRLSLDKKPEEIVDYIPLLLV